MSEPQAKYITGKDGLQWRPVEVRLGDLDGWPDNPKLLTKSQAQKLLESTQELGQFSTIAVSPVKPGGRRDLYDGHQRDGVWSKAYHPDIVVWALELSRFLSDDERAGIAYRSVFATGSIDWNKTASFPVGKVISWGADSEALKGWNNDALNLREMLGAEEATQEPDFKEYGEDIADGIQVCECPTCGHKHAAKKD